MMVDAVDRADMYNDYDVGLYIIHYMSHFCEQLACDMIKRSVD